MGTGGGEVMVTGGEVMVTGGGEVMVTEWWLRSW